MKSLDSCLAFIQEGRLAEALEQLAERVRDEDSGLRSTVIQILSRYKRLERDRLRGLRAQGDYTIELNQITYHTIDLIEAIRADGGFHAPEAEPTYTGAKTRILIALASPDDGGRLHLDTEVREIEAVLRAGTHRDRFELHKIGATRPSDLLAAMLRIKPHFFHFSGHGHADAIHLLDDDHQSLPIPKDQLVQLFGHFKDTIGCVFLNACYSLQQAQAIRQHIPHVLGTTQKIGDAVAIQYAVSFYQAIAEGEAVEYAFEFAKMSVGFSGLGGGEGLVLIDN